MDTITISRDDAKRVIEVLSGSGNLDDQLLVERLENSLGYRQPTSGQLSLF